MDVVFWRTTCGLVTETTLKNGASFAQSISRARGGHDRHILDRNKEGIYSCYSFD
jgi:hypothetical protein